jgi:hypothetical protein
VSQQDVWMMSDSKATLRVIALVVHPLAAIVLLLLFFKTWGMTVLCVVPGVLIGCGSVAARPGRPVTLYAAFGVLMGYAFWMGASAVSQGAIVAFVPILLLVAGALWLLQQPSWPSAIFAGVVVLLCLGLALLEYRQHPEFMEYDPELIRRSALTSFVVLSLGLVYLALGFAEASLQAPRKAKRATRRVKRPRTGRSDLTSQAE